MAEKRSIILRAGGSAVVYDEQAAAVAQIKPGYLVKRTNSGAAVQTASGVKAPFVIATEREELGKGIDATYETDAATPYYYASGDRVKVAICPPGTVVTAWIASGQNIQKDELLSSAGDGTLAAETDADNAMAISLEEVGAVTVLTAIKVQVV
jgi:hypothetical protein